MGMFDVFAEHDGLCVPHIVGFQILADTFGNELPAFLDDDVTVEFLLLVTTYLDRVAVHVRGSLRRQITIAIDIQFRNHNFVGREEPVFDSLLE